MIKSRNGFCELITSTPPQDIHFVIGRFYKNLRQSLDPFKRKHHSVIRPLDKKDGFLQYIEHWETEGQWYKMIRSGNEALMKYDAHWEMCSEPSGECIDLDH